MYREVGEASPILVSAFNGRVFGLDPRSGAIVWSVLVENGMTVEIVIVQGTVIAATMHRLAFIEYLSGRALGVVPLGAGYPARPTMVVEGNRIFIGGSGEVSCYAATGQLLWSQKFPQQGIGAVALGVPGNVRQADFR